MPGKPAHSNKLITGSELVMPLGQAHFKSLRNKNISRKSFSPRSDRAAAINARVHAFNEQMRVIIEIVHIQMVVVPFNWCSEISDNTSSQMLFCVAPLFTKIHLKFINIASWGL